MSVMPSNILIILLFLITRIVAIAILGTITNGSEVASDIDFYRMIIEHPLGILSGNLKEEISSYAPLQFMLTVPLYHMLSTIVSDFWTYRLIMLSAEFGAMLCLLMLIDHLRSSGASQSVRPNSYGEEPVNRWFSHLSERQLFALKLLIVIQPTLLLTGSAFVQDEMICLLAVSLAVLAASRENWTFAILCLCAGVLTAKIFLVLPAVYLLIFRQFNARNVAILASVAAVYTIVVFNAIQKGGFLPIVDFSPSADYSSTVWSMLMGSHPEQIDMIKRVSLLSTVITQTLLFTYLAFRMGIQKRAVSTFALFALPLSLAFLTLYQHNAEYLLLFFPACIALAGSFRAILWISFVYALAWLPRILFGLLGIGGKTASTQATRDALLQNFVNALPIDLSSAHTVAILLYSVAYVSLVAYLFHRADVSNIPR